MTVKWEDQEYETIEDAMAALGGTRQLWRGRIRAGRTRNKRKGGVRSVIYRGVRYDSLADAARAHGISREAVRQWVTRRTDEDNRYAD